MQAPVASVRIEVNYAFGEYMSVLRQYIRQTEAESPPAASMLARFWRSRAVESVGLALLAPPSFLIKKLVLGRCAFEFSSSGIERVSRGRRAARNWNQVKRVLALESAYLIELNEGALLIPYRSFSPGNRRSFMHLLPRHLSPTPSVNATANSVASGPRNTVA